MVTINTQSVPQGQIYSDKHKHPTLKQKLKFDLAILPGHSQLTLGQPVLALTLQHQDFDRADGERKKLIPDLVLTVQVPYHYATETITGK